MPQIPLHYVDLRTFCYATEDEKRVEEALRTFLPGSDDDADDADDTEPFEIERVESDGHFGDRILVLSARIESADDVRYVLSRLADLESFDTLIGELDERVTENTELFLRLDKQAAFGGDVKLGDGITFRGKVEAYPAKKEKAVANAEDVLTQLRDDE
ncbi:RNA-binding protein [Natronolimnobius sp. AArcel1]|uniref:RNA-binding protein n=1 Tax=Natronolimnobius sp. AArcel1 TaxID=1679093 RepID=UPI0013EA8FD9|nr:RNA-binding protein [Natronolimnobius sp. AArcel1]NGM69284.1 RNA-binding protein [Natronolimnobius sp. AArcel1]